jgi:periplasmic protein TonB
MKTRIVLGLMIVGMVRVYGQVDVPDSLGNNDNSNKIFEFVDNPPKFPGGMMELYKYIEENTQYPKTAKRKGIKGKVFVEFIIDKDGSIIRESVKVVPFSDLKIRGLKEVDIITNAEYQEEALRVVKSCPNWIPGTHHNHPVRVKYILPIKFG